MALTWPTLPLAGLDTVAGRGTMHMNHPSGTGSTDTVMPEQLYTYDAVAVEGHERRGDERADFLRRDGVRGAMRPVPGSGKRHKW